ncbi:MAG: GNAT family N-acetyltransferase [Betaproteobacteria bacterium]
MTFRIEPARSEDCGVLMDLIRALAEYERLTHMVTGTEAQLRHELFGERPVIEAVIGWEAGRPVGFALYFHNYSTFLARRGLYLEDLFVVPQARGRGYGKALIAHCARIAVARGCGRFEWSVLDWNQPAIDFYRSLGAELLPDGRICRMTGESLARLGAATRSGNLPA